MPPADIPAEQPSQRRQRNPRGQGSRLREEIIRATTVLLEKTANEETITLRAIAREIGIASPSISAHFADRAEILDAVIAREVTALYETLSTAAASETDPVAKFLAAARAYYLYGTDRPNRYRLLFARRFLSDWSEERTMSDTLQVTGATFQMVVDLIQGCIDAGRSSCPDAVTATVATWAALHGLVSLPQAITSFPWPDMERLMDSTLSSIVGISPPSA